jgi:predicted amidohydrolase
VKDLSVSIAQMAPTLLDVSRNLEKIRLFMKEAVSSGSQLLVLPEMALTGYGIEGVLADGHSRAAFAAETGHAVRELRADSGRLGLDIVVSYPIFSKNRVFIAAEYIGRGKRLAVHRKVNLCNYAHYTEHLHFTAGDRLTVVRTEQAACGLLVCEDFWHAANGIVETLYGAEILVVPSAPCVRDQSHGPISIARWELLSRSAAFLQTSYVVLVSRAGQEGDNTFLGGSHVVSPEGEFICRLPLFEEGMAQVNLQAASLREVRRQRPLLENERVDLYKKFFAEVASEMQAPVRDRK